MYKALVNRKVLIRHIDQIKKSQTPENKAFKVNIWENTIPFTIPLTTVSPNNKLQGKNILKELISLLYNIKLRVCWN